MNKLTENIFDKWSMKLPLWEDKYKYQLLSVAKSSVRDFSLMEAVNFIKEIIKNPKQCYVCNKVTGYVHGRILGNDIRWHCIGACG